MAINPWSDLTKQLDSIYNSGITMKDAFSSLSSDGEETRSYNQENITALAKWIQIAYKLSIRDQHAELSSIITKLFEEYTTLRVSQAEELTLQNFGRGEDHFETDPDEDCEYVDIVDAHYRIQLLIQEMICESKFAEKTISNPLLNEKRLISIQELAEIRNIEPNSIRKEVSKFRKEHGRDPRWVVNIPHGRSQYMINWPIYYQSIRTGKD